jgi:hypothetical protein
VSSGVIATNWDNESIFVSTVSDTILSNTIVEIARIDTNCLEVIGGNIHIIYEIKLTIVNKIQILYVFFSFSFSFAILT